MRLRSFSRAVANASPRQQHTAAAPAVTHSMPSFNPMQSYAEDCLHDSIFKGSAPVLQPVTVSPSRIAVPDTIEEEATGGQLQLHALVDVGLNRVCLRQDCCSCHVHYTASLIQGPQLLLSGLPDILGLFHGDGTEKV